MVSSVFAWKRARNDIQLGKAPNHKFGKHVPLNNNNIYCILKSVRRTATAAALSLEKDVILDVVEKWKSLTAHGIEPQSPGR
jgi:hypothetical protein